MPKLDPEDAPMRQGAALLPEPLASEFATRQTVRLGELAGLTQFGVNVVTVAPGRSSSPRHWHRTEDEFALVLEGELVLVEDDGEVTMRSGDVAAWRAGVPNGHHFINRSTANARFLVVGGKCMNETVTYSDLDLVVRVENGTPSLSRKAAGSE